ncbi:LysR family transcriptional regulator [Salsuginibacillus kocurii]|uniref:LysR family transcriptional regulator n=1 Tax=Salsuginibacillus kocurii TaxID=427078 RepID=UPI000373FFA4|nr:LysR family transcriptional regulator [Salsuginibacillus kocurii]
MKYTDYELIQALYEEKTVRAAARRLLISQPAISQRLKALETNWGETMFIRTSTSLLPTPAGEKIADYAREMLAKEEQLRAELDHLSEKVQGRLSLGVSSVLGQYFLPSVLERFIERYPAVDLHINTGLSDHLLATDNTYHLLLTRGERPQHLAHEYLFADPLFYVQKKDTDPSLFIRFKSDDTFEKVVHEWLTAHKKTTSSSLLQVDQIETCKQLVKRGVGSSVLPLLALQDVNEERIQIEPLLSENEQAVRHNWCAWRAGAELLPQVQAFLREIQAELKS